MRIKDYSVRFMACLVCCTAICTLCACKGNRGGNGNFPDDFNGRTDGEKVAYMMEAATPDSVARFICYASLGYIDGVSLKSVNDAVLYATEHYKREEELTQFGVEFENIQVGLPLADHMKIMKLAGTEDPMGMGLRLGLDYFEQLRDGQKSAAEVDREIAAFRKACGNDTATYVRFVKGFKAALREGGGRGIDPNVYRKYSNMPESL